MHYIVDAGIDPELICSRLWKASQFYTPAQLTCHKKTMSLMHVNVCVNLECLIDIKSNLSLLYGYYNQEMIRKCSLGFIQLKMTFYPYFEDWQKSR